MSDVDEIFADLIEATQDELLGAYLDGMRVPQEYRWLVLAGYRLAGRNGWQLVAPSWLEDYRNKRDGI